MMDALNALHPALKYVYERVYAKSAPVDDGTPEVKGYDFNNGVNYQKIFQTLSNVGFQASHLAQAIRVVQEMIDCKFQPVPPITKTSFHKSHTPAGRKTSNCTIMLGCTSNMASSGNREIIRYLVEHGMVDLVVMTAGGIEEDIMKCLTTFYIGDFHLDGAELHAKSHNRTGNLIVPNNAYRQFNTWLFPILETMVEEQNNGENWAPSKFIWRMGKEINHPDSILYWAYKNKIPIFSPAVTDGALGDAMYIHRHTHPQNCLKLDVVEDIQFMNDMAVFSVHTAVLVLGAGVIKHHILNANCFRNGSDFSVYVNTAAEFDGSDSGAMPDEAVSWGKIRVNSKMVKVFADATVVLPILVGETFAKRQKEFEVFNDSQ